MKIIIAKSEIAPKSEIAQAREFDLFVVRAQT